MTFSSPVTRCRVRLREVTRIPWRRCGVARMKAIAVGPAGAAARALDARFTGSDLDRRVLRDSVGGVLLPTCAVPEDSSP